MKHYYTILLSFLITIPAMAQHKISGKVTDMQQRPLAGANIYIKGTFDGATSAQDGSFSFTTSENGRQVLVASLLEYQPDSMTIQITSAVTEQKIVLHKAINKLNAVTISAGSFSISDKSRNTMLTPLDIVNIAGAGADPMNALRTLPGAQRVPDQTGLFVLGGTGEETKAFIDGMVVQHPFYSATPEIGSRGRFNPFLFKGTVFSSGGYSAQYGGALSAAVILDSRDLPEQSSATLGISSVGLSGGIDCLSKNKKASYGGSMSYANLWPYFKLVSQKQDYTLAPFDWNGDFNFRVKTSSTGMLKFYGYGDYNKIRFGTTDINDPNRSNLFGLTNGNAYANLSYNESVGKNKDWRLYIGSSYNINTDWIHSGAKEKTGPTISDTAITDFTQLSEQKIMLTHPIGLLSSIRGGIAYQYETDRLSYQEYKASLNDNYTAAFLESDIYLTSHLVARVGARGEYSSLLDQYNLAPRVSLAYQLGQATQLSAAWGDFYEKPENRYLLMKPNLDFMKATHYILDFQHVKEDYTWRVELFYKKYNNLLKTAPDTATNGGGYARGIELFWRDKHTIKNGDYWISYTYLDTKRNYLDYPYQVQPSYAAKNTLNIVYKQFIPSIMTNLSATYSFVSGRPYYNPNRTENEYMADRTPALNTLSFSTAYLIKGKKTFTVLVFSVSNVLGNKQVYGYSYSNDGSKRQEITSPARRFFFIGAFFSFGIDRSQDIIDNNL